MAPSFGRRNTASPARTRASAPRTRVSRSLSLENRPPTPRAPRWSSTGASSTMISRVTGAIAANSSAFWWPLNRSTDENMTAPRIASARMLSSVWETSVPSTTGRCSRGRPVRRATTSAREGSPSRAGSVEDMSTPMNVPCIASDSRTRARGSAARRIACQENARRTIAPHITPSPSRTNVGLELMSAEAIFGMPIFCSASHASTRPPIETAASASRRTIAKAGLRRRSSFGSSEGSRWARTRGFRSAERAPTATATRWSPGAGAGVAIASS